MWTNDKLLCDNKIDTDITLFNKRSNNLSSYARAQLKNSQLIKMFAVGNRQTTYYKQYRKSLLFISYTVCVNALTVL